MEQHTANRHWRMIAEAKIPVKFLDSFSAVDEMCEADDGAVLEDEDELDGKPGFGEEPDEGRLKFFLTEFIGDVGVEVRLCVGVGFGARSAVSRVERRFDVDRVGVEQKAKLFPAKDPT